MVSRLNQLKKIKSSVALLLRLLIIINMLCLFIKNRFIYFKYTNKWFLFYHMHKNWLEKPLDFSVQRSEPETVLFRGKDDPLRLFFCLLLHEKWLLALSHSSLSSLLDVQDIFRHKFRHKSPKKKHLSFGLPNTFKTAICGKFKDINSPVNIGEF